jgi:A/G-specific adenine glycosylase
VSAVLTLEQDPIPEAITRALAAWHAVEGRRLRFRATTDPWAVLVSEVMAQQTQVARVEPAWSAFLAAYPTPTAFAAATPASALRTWSGLGYNRRALALRRAAATIGERHGGRVPAGIDELEALPGIGPYTARAVAAIAFGVPVAAVDTNVRRVVGRLVAGHGAADDPGTGLTPALLQERADALVDRRDPGAWTHALMDLGATVCRPRSAPRCDACPLATWCRYRRSAGMTTRAPVRGRRAAPGVSFPATRRWLRGHIVGLLRDRPDGAWMQIEGPVGEHDPAAVAKAIADLARDGLVELGPDGRVRLPSDGP